MASNDSSAKLKLDILVQRFKRFKLVSFFTNLALFSITIFFLLSLFGLTLDYSIWLLMILAILAVFFFIRSDSYSNIKSENILQHINRHDDRYRESAQLILTKANSAKPLKSIQKDRIEKLFVDDFSCGKLSQLSPTINYKLTLSLLFVIALIFVVGNDIRKIFGEFTSTLATHNQIKNTPDQTDKLKTPFISESNIKITPPSYTGLSEFVTNDMNLEVPEDSNVRWSLKFSDPSNDYYLSRSRMAERNLVENNEIFSTSEVIKQTSLYGFSYQNKKIKASLDGVYSINIIKDKAPRIKIIQPNQSLLEFDKSSNPEFTLKANISDDYAISEIKILASVAKGSGEAVKFRDKEFRFSKTEDGKSDLYIKHWRLRELDMESGDEIYFRISATDNRQPKTQSAQSSTIIVRWLDEDTTEITAEGVRIGFIPEYFRSQRQIIIETEQLISDQRDLKIDEFQATSTDLGHSQSDLKQKYGQYLGDEFGEDYDEKFGIADGYHGGETHSAGEASTGIETEEEHSEDSTHSPEHEHEQQNSEQPETTDKSGATEIIKRFTHNHGTSEIGPMSNRDPKTWMKMAVNEMWQAELHLMLSEPQQALPFEYKAYEYLKRARQADRIYAKRLGFKPPPVTEDRRLSGELKDILEYDLAYLDKKKPPTDNSLFTQAYHLLNNPKHKVEFSDLETELLSMLSARLLELSEVRPALIKYATTARKFSLSGSRILKDCEQCLLQLKGKLWQLLSTPVALPKTMDKLHNIPTDIEKDYLNDFEETGTNDE